MSRNDDKNILEEAFEVLDGLKEKFPVLKDLEDYKKLMKETNKNSLIERINKITLCQSYGKDKDSANITASFDLLVVQIEGGKINSQTVLSRARGENVAQEEAPAGSSSGSAAAAAASSSSSVAATSREEFARHSRGYPELETDQKERKKTNAQTKLKEYRDKKLIDINKLLLIISKATNISKHEAAKKLSQIQNGDDVFFNKSELEALLETHPIRAKFFNSLIDSKLRKIAIEILGADKIKKMDDELSKMSDSDSLTIRANGECELVKGAPQENNLN